MQKKNYFMAIPPISREISQYRYQANFEIQIASGLNQSGFRIIFFRLSTITSLFLTYNSGKMNWKNTNSRPVQIRTLIIESKNIFLRSRKIKGKKNNWQTGPNIPYDLLL